MVKSSPSSAYSTHMLFSFRSLWHTLWVLIFFTADATCCIILHSVLLVSLLFFTKLLRVSPAYSVNIWGRETHTPTNFYTPDTPCNLLRYFTSRRRNCIPFLECGKCLITRLAPGSLLIISHLPWEPTPKGATTVQQSKSSWEDNSYTPAFLHTDTNSLST